MRRKKEFDIKTGFFGKGLTLMLAAVLATGMLAGCGDKKDGQEEADTLQTEASRQEQEPQIDYAAFTVSTEAESGVTFRAEYADLMEEGLNLVYTDAIDGSYMQTMKVAAKPENMTWRNTLLSSEISNANDFVTLEMSGVAKWQKQEFGDATFEYLSVSDGEIMYSMGILYHKDATHGVMIYGNFEEDVLLERAASVQVDTEGMTLTVDGRTPYFGFSDGGMTLQQNDVLFFENQKQLEAYLTAKGRGITVGQIQGGAKRQFAGMEMPSVGYGIDGNKQIYISGEIKGGVYADGIVTLPNEKGYLLVRYSSRKGEGNVEDVADNLLTMEKYFALMVQ